MIQYFHRLPTPLVIEVDIPAVDPYTGDVDMLYSAFAQNLRSMRRARGFSQADLADVSGISRATIASIEGCRQAVLLHQAASLAAALEVPLTQLVQAPLGDLEELRGVVADEDLQKILEMTKGLR